jgi:hypothetical protein
MSHHLHMSNWMAVGGTQPKKSKEIIRIPGNKNKTSKADAYKTVMCQAWLESKVCIFADTCRFAHGEEELRVSKVLPKQNNKYKTKLCDKYTTTGLCPYGSRCLFIHPDNGTNDYIRPDKLVEVSQRHALADMNARQLALRPVTPDMPGSAFMFGNTPLSSRMQLQPHPSWPLESADFFTDKTEEMTPLNVQNLFGCFEPATTPNRVSLASGLSGYVSGATSPFSTISSSCVNLNISDDEHFERDYFRITGLDSLAEELTRNLTAPDLW